MSDNPAKEAFADLLTHLEHLETVTGAILQFMKENGIATEEKLAPYLEQASKASDVRMRAARARMEHLFSADETAKPATEAVPAPPQKEGTQKSAPRSENKNEDAARDIKPAHDDKSKTQPSSDKKPETSPEHPNEPSEIIAGREAAKDHSSPKSGESRPEPDRTKEKDAA